MLMIALQPAPKGEALSYRPQIRNQAPVRDAEAAKENLEPETWPLYCSQLDAKWKETNSLRTVAASREPKLPGAASDWTVKPSASLERLTRIQWS